MNEDRPTKGSEDSELTRTSSEGAEKGMTTSGSESLPAGTSSEKAVKEMGTEALETERSESAEGGPTPGSSNGGGGATGAGMQWDGTRWLSADGAQAFDEERKTWVPVETVPAATGSVSDQAEIGGLWVHRDPSTGILSVFNAETGAWVPEQEEEEEGEEEEQVSEDDELAFQLQQAKEERRRLNRRKKEAKAAGKAVYVCPKDNAVWEWTPKIGWAPELDDDFLARYQASYGNYKPPTPEEKPPEEEEEKKEESKGKKRKKEPEWFEVDTSQTCNVYVQGLPTSDFDETAFAEMMAKCGVLSIDPRTRKPKVKLYREEDGSLKGDGLASYFKRESVDLALKVIDGSRNKDGNPISVSVAKFQLKGSFDPTVAKKNKLTKAQKKLAQEKAQKILDWKPEKLIGERPKSDSVLVLTGLFDPSEFFEMPEKLLECEEVLKTECARYGPLVKVTVFATNPEGVAMVKYASPPAADDALTMLDYRVIREHQIRAKTWDGVTNYKVRESEEVIKARQSQWSQFLEDSTDS